MNSDQQSEKNVSTKKCDVPKRKYLIIIIPVLLIIFISLTVLIFIYPGHSSICLSSSCVKTSADILTAIDLNVDPCEDFYKFACGNFDKSNQIPDGPDSIDVVEQIKMSVWDKLRILVEKPIEISDTRPFVFLKHFYQSCMNTSNPQPFLAFTQLLKEFGGWPAVEGNNWRDNHFDLQKNLQKFMNYGINYNILFSTHVKPQNSSRNILEISQPSNDEFSTLLSKGWQAPEAELYYNYMLNVAKIFGANETLVSNELKKVVSFEMALTQIRTPTDILEKQSGMVLTIYQIQQKYSYVNWLQYFNIMLQPMKVTLEEEIIVKSPDFFKKLGPLIQSTPKRVLANYVFWRLTRDLVFALNNNLRSIEDEFFSNAFGITQRPPRYQECFERFPAGDVILSSLYVKNFFKDDIKTKVTEMITILEESAKSMLEESVKINKTAAINEINNLKKFVAFPQELLDDSEVNEYYRELKIDRSSLINSILDANKFSDKKKLQRLNNDHKLDWTFRANSAKVNALYDKDNNAIEIPAALLQGRIYDSDRPQYINYGAAGSLIGRQFMYYFDQFSIDHEKKDWQCFAKQFNHISKQKTNMMFDELEVITDTLGLKIAFEAYLDWKENNEVEAELPGLSFTSEQLFWIASAQRQCSILRPDSQNANYPQKSARIQVNLALMNSKIFSDIFTCSEGSKMNPVKKCMIW